MLSLSNRLNIVNGKKGIFGTRKGRDFSDKGRKEHLGQGKEGAFAARTVRDISVVFFTDKFLFRQGNKIHENFQ